MHDRAHGTIYIVPFDLNAFKSRSVDRDSMPRGTVGPFTAVMRKNNVWKFRRCQISPNKIFTFEDNSEYPPPPISFSCSLVFHPQTNVTFKLKNSIERGLGGGEWGLHIPLRSSGKRPIATRLFHSPDLVATFEFESSLDKIIYRKKEKNIGTILFFTKSTKK